MFFFKNVFVKFGLNLSESKFLNINFKKKYKIYLFFAKNQYYFTKFFNSLHVNNLTTFIYFNLLLFMLRKNFNNNSYKLLYIWISDESLLYCLVYFLNKTFNANTKVYLVDKKLNLLFNNSFKVIVKLKNLFFFKNTNFLQKSFSTPLNNYDVRYSGTSLGKYLNDVFIGNSSIFFLRKNKMFNKGRYSRNRQNYRTGVYWCLYINIMVLYALYFYFYGFVFNFGYLWWLLYFFFASFFLPRLIKFRLYDPRIFFKTFFESTPLVFYLVKNKN